MWRPGRSSACRPTRCRARSALDLEAGANFRFVVHQAAGMVAVQLAVPVEEALVRLRAHAFSSGRLVVDVATDVVNRRLRFDRADGDGHGDRDGDGRSS